MEETLQTWLSSGITGLTTIISVLLLILKGMQVVKTNGINLENVVINAVNQIYAQSEERQAKLIERQNKVIESQNVTINTLLKGQEDNSRQIAQLTKLVNKVIDKRVD